MRYPTAFLLILGLAVDGSAGARDAMDNKLVACAPITFDQAVQCLHDELSSKAKADLLAPDGALRAHTGLGMFLRNEWGLWKHGPLAVSLIGLGFKHPDDMSATILEAYVAREQGKPFDIKGKIAEYDAYWDRQLKQ